MPPRRRQAAQAAASPEATIASLPAELLTHILGSLTRKDR